MVFIRVLWGVRGIGVIFMVVMCWFFVLVYVCWSRGRLGGWLWWGVDYE